MYVLIYKSNPILPFLKQLTSCFKELFKTCFYLFVEWDLFGYFNT